MNIIELTPYTIKPNTAAAVGFFDGVHKAHEVLIGRMIERANKLKLKKAIITFDKHPKQVLFNLDYYYITPFEQKIEKLKQFDIDDIYVIRFTKAIASMNPKAFIDQYLANLKLLICGFDFKFGEKASGDIGLLKTYADFETDVIEKQTYSGYKIGSSHIRYLIQGGLVDEIPPLLGSFYRIKGTVIAGMQKGRTINYPTANIDGGDFLYPKRGVYATMSKVKDTWYQSMTSIGFNPTLNPQKGLSVESYLFDFSADIYGETIETVFVKRLRNEEKFDSKDALIQQIDKDGEETLKVLKGVKDDARIYH